MKKILISTMLVLGMMAITTGCTGNHSSDTNAKCSAAEKCDKAKKCESGKCGSEKEMKKCGAGKCGSK